jgi:putative SOS response-associated peptidase YedK
MCGRFAFYSPHEAVVRLFGLPDDTPEVEPHYNIAPTTFVPAVREDVAATRRLALLYWGLVPAWAKDKAAGARMINARAETLRDKPAFRSAFQRRRALVAADGYYEWMKLGARDKQPYFIQPASGTPFAFGALWERWRDPATGEPLESCAIITTAAAPAVAHIHDRMPLIVPPDAYAEWLDRRNQDVDRLERLLQPEAAGSLLARPVSRLVSNARNDGAQLIDPWQEGQSTPSLRFDEPVTSQLPFDEPGSSRLPFDEAGTPQLPFDEPARPPDDRDA